MNIIGINYFYHDSAACVVRDGKLIIALEEERLTRKKHTSAFPTSAITRCLQEAKLSRSDIDAIAISAKPELDWHRRLAYCLRHLPRSLKLLKYELGLYYGKRRELESWLSALWPNPLDRPKIHFVPHHLAHAAGTFFVSPYDSAAIMSVDGSGEWASSMLGRGEGTTVDTFSSSYFPMSLGSVYEAVTQFCGFQNCYDEGKTMGLAPLGDHTVYKDAVEKILNVNEDGTIHVDLSYFNYQFWEDDLCSEKFFEVFGHPRARNKGEFKSNHLNTAAAFQHVLEERCLQLADIMKKKTGEKYLIIAGGVGLNSVMNGRVVRESGFDDIYVMPAAGDNGTAIGAAYYVHNGLMGHPRSFVHRDPYVGTEYSNEFISNLIDECKLRAEYCEDIEEVTARYLQEGRIVGWFQGKMEVGPRALGNRSILANPTLSHMKDKINAEVKHREAFRPFAPSAIVEEKDTFFDLRVEAPFMLKVCNVREDAKSRLPAVTHVDGTARLQTVRKDVNPRFYNLISAFGRLSGTPVLLNTSFNIMGEPIVEHPIDAIRCFFSTGLDVLVLGNHLIRKEQGSGDGSTPELNALAS